MKLRHFFGFNLILAIFFGVGCTLFPHLLASFYQLTLNEAGAWATRMVGGSFLAFSTLIWFGIRIGSLQARRAIAFALLVNEVIGLVASIEIKIIGPMNTLGWINPVLFGILALGHIYFLFIKPANS